MDPITPTSLSGTAFAVAKGALDVGNALCQIFQDGRVIGRTAEAFANEIKALGAACNIVGERVRSISKRGVHQEFKHPEAGSPQLWQCLGDQLRGCESTIDELQIAISCFTEESSSSDEQTFIKRAFREIKLNMKVKDLSEAKNRIQSHTASLRIVLQAVVIEISYVAPQRVDQHLQAELGRLAANKRELEDLRAGRNSEDNQSYLTINEEHILYATEYILSSGGSLYESSVAGGSTLGESTATNDASIREWIRDTSAFAKLNSESSIYESDSFSDVSTVRNTRTSQTQNKTSTEEARKRNAYDRCDNNVNNHKRGFDPMDEFKIKLTQAAVDESRSLFESKDFERAEETLREALKIFSELEVKQQRRFDVCKLRYMLAVCAFHTRQPCCAEDALLSVLEENKNAKNQSDIRRGEALHASHLLAITYLRLGKPEQAQTYCDSTFEGRSLLFGRDHDCTYESLALMAEILDLQGQATRASLVVRMIAPARKDSVFRALPEASAGVPIPIQIPPIDPATKQRFRDLFNSVIVPQNDRFNRIVIREREATPTPLIDEATKQRCRDLFNSVILPQDDRWGRRRAEASGDPRLDRATMESLYDLHLDRRPVDSPRDPRCERVMVDYLDRSMAQAIFEQSDLPNDVLGRIWTLFYQDNKFNFQETDFIVAMHLIVCIKAKKLTRLPDTLRVGCNGIIEATIGGPAASRGFGKSRESKVRSVSPGRSVSPVRSEARTRREWL